MSVFRHRVSVAALAVALPLAVSAQVGIRITWTAPGGAKKTCVATSNEAGVSMDPNNGDFVLDGAFSGDCPGDTAPLPPVITNGLDASELPVSSTIGTTHTVAWSADADRCSYSASSFPSPVTGWPTSGDTCNSAASCATMHSVPITLPVVPGNYAFNLSCWRNGVTAPATSQRTVTVTGTSACVAPAGFTRVNEAYVEFNYTQPGAGRTTDATLFEKIFGYFDETSPLRTFPGTRNVNQRVFLTRNSYAALRFTVPSTLTTSTSGLFRFEETQPQTDRMSFTISRTCGDFSLTPAEPLAAACVRNNLVAGSALHWIVGNSAPGYCRLEPGETYYLNIVHADLTPPMSSSCAGYCGNTIQNAIGPGSPAWP
jgi:hypothetical protein